MLGNCLILLVDGVNPGKEYFAVLIFIVCFFVCFLFFLFFFSGRGMEMRNERQRI